MKILVLPRYGPLGASSRLRMYQYLPALERLEVEVAVSPLLDDAHVRTIALNKKRYLGNLGDIIRRIRTFSNTNAEKILWVEKELLPWLPWGIERSLLRKAMTLVTDYDDAIFHNYDLHRNPFVRRLLGRKIDRVMAASTIVFAGNNYLAGRARRAGARDVRIIPTVVDTTRYQVISRETRTEPRIGWIGSPSTWEQYLKPMMPMLANVAADAGAMINVVGAPPSAGSFPETTFLPWSEEAEVSLIQDMDIGIMPLDDSPWARGKCGYKLIQYMACGLPVVASPVGVNAEIVEHGVNGFLARNDAEWREALMTLLNDPDLRRRMGAAGRKKVEREYSLQVYGPKVAQIFCELIEGKGATP